MRYDAAEKGPYPMMQHEVQGRCDMCTERELEHDPPPSYPVTDVQGEDDGQHACGRVATVMLVPVLINVLKEHRVHHQNLQA